MSCAALEWDKTLQDYVECSPASTIHMVRLIGLVTAEMPLCDNHRRFFEEEMQKFGGHLDRKKRVQIIKKKGPSSPTERQEKA